MKDPSVQITIDAWRSGEAEVLHPATEIVGQRADALLYTPPIASCSYLPYAFFEALKSGLRGCSFSSLKELREAVAAHTKAINERIHSVTHRRPIDLFTQEQRGSMPEPYPIVLWSEGKVRRDCHVQVQYNYCSVPHQFVGKTVVVRTDAQWITVFDDLQEIAHHHRASGRGSTVTDRSHYPEEKRATQEDRRAERLQRIRSVGPGAAAFWHGLHTSRDYVHSDQVRALLRLLS